MKPIETNYRGVTFRSRTEARWAVFMDTLEIAWQYEPKTFSIGNLGRYTPDFYLPNQDWHAEVKPVWPVGLEIERCRKLFHPVVLMIGLPDYHSYWLIGEDASGKYEESIAFLFRGFDRGRNVFGRYQNQHDFPPAYHRAVDKAKTARFDGYDKDRGEIIRRYA